MHESLFFGSDKTNNDLFLKTKLGSNRFSEIIKNCMMTSLSLYKVPTLPYGTYTVRKKNRWKNITMSVTFDIKRDISNLFEFFYLIE